MSLRQTDSTLAQIASYKRIEGDAKGIGSSDAKVESCAVEIIGEFALNPQSTFSPDKEKGFQLKLDRVLAAMLAHAMEIGGESSKHYVLSCIMACEQRGHQEGKECVFSLLRDLGIIWLTHFLFIFKIPIHHSDATYVSMTGDIWEEIAELLRGDVGKTNTFRDDLLIRDGHKCVISGRVDDSHPTDGDGILLEATHFLRRSMSRIELKDHNSPYYDSAVTTFNILRNYTCLPDDILNNLESHIDDTSNGMMLDHHLHAAFDHFYWCLKPTETDNVYKISQVAESKTGCWATIPKGCDQLRDPVVFNKKSGEFVEGKRDCDFAIPNPMFVGIHAAVAEILHMSGAGKFFDELLDCFGDGDGSESPVRCWLEFESIITK